MSFDIFDNSLNFFCFGYIDQICYVFMDYWMVGWYNYGIQFIDRVEFKGFGIGCIGYFCQFFVQMEVVLEGDRGQSLVFVLDFYVFFGFNGLVQIIGLVVVLYCMVSVFIDDDNFVIFDNVVNVVGEQCMGVQCGGNVVYQYNVGWRVQGFIFIYNIFLYQQFFNQYQIMFGQVNLMCFFIY